MTDAFLVDGVRTPIGRYGGALSGVATKWTEEPEESERSGESYRVQKLLSVNRSTPGYAKAYGQLRGPDDATLSVADLDAEGGAWDLVSGWSSDVLGQDDFDTVGAILQPGAAAAIIMYFY